MLAPIFSIFEGRSPIQGPEGFRWICVLFPFEAAAFQEVGIEDMSERVGGRVPLG